MTQKFKLNSRALLTGGISDVDTSLTIEVAKADSFPVANTDASAVGTVGLDWFKAVLQDSAGNIEVIYVRTRGVGVNVFSNVIRGQEGTTALSFTAGSVVGLRITAEDIMSCLAGVFATITGNLIGNVTGNLLGTGSIASTITGTTAAAKTSDTKIATNAFADRLRSMLTGSTGGTAVVTDRGCALLLASAPTIPASVFAALDVFTLYNNTGSPMTVTQGGGLTLRQCATSNTGNRTLPARGLATVFFVSATEAVITGCS